MFAVPQQQENAILMAIWNLLKGAKLLTALSVRFQRMSPINAADFRASRSPTSEVLG